MSFLSKLTTKSQVTVPKDVRNALGVGPGARVEFHIGEDGRVSLAAANEEEERELRKSDFLKRIAEVRKRFRLQDQMPNSGMDGLAYQRWIRGDGPEV
jgi:AbrB family looped-hinge helix DNA binding protein